MLHIVPVKSLDIERTVFQEILNFFNIYAFQMNIAVRGFFYIKSDAAHIHIQVSCCLRGCRIRNRILKISLVYRIAAVKIHAVAYRKSIVILIVIIIIVT